MSSSNSSIPLDSVHHIEDVGHLLLEAQRDLARVRARLESLPLESSSSSAAGAAGSAAGMASDTLDSLRELLNKTETQLRAKGEMVLRSVEDNKLNTLPALTSPSHSTGLVRYSGDFDVSSAMVPQHPENALVASPARAQAAASAAQYGGLQSPLRRQATMSSSQLAQMRRPVGERMQEARQLDMLARAPYEAQLSAAQGGATSTGAGPARDFVAAKFGLTSEGSASAPPPYPSPSAASSSSSSSSSPIRPIERYGRAWRDTKIVRGSRITPSILPKSVRHNPRAFPVIGTADANQGILSLVQRGFIPSFVDVTSAFSSAPAPLQQAPVAFHNYNEQFKSRGGGAPIATHAAVAGASGNFNLSAVKLDLGHEILDAPEGGPNEFERGMMEREKQQQLQQQQLRLEEEKQNHNDWRAAPSTTFAFPALMPGESDETRMRVVSDEGVEDLFASSDQHAQAQAQALMAPSAEQEDGGKVREYDELLDAYSLHQFLIRKGKALSNTPEFLSFARRHQAGWGAVKSVIAALERLCKAHRIQIATINGARVVALAEREAEVRALTPAQLLSCFELDAAAASASSGVGLDPMLKALLHSPAAFKYSMGGDVARLLAALKIQSCWRMWMQRRLYVLYRHRHTKAVLIQRCWRRFQTVLRTRARIASRWGARLEHWNRDVQTPWRDSVSCGRWGRKKRVHVHVASISTEPYQRANMFNFAVRENAQLSRLCDAADADVDVLYVAPFALTADVQSYYLKLLEIGGVGSVGSRVKIVTPENARRFPEHFSLAKQTLYSPRTLRKMREHIRGRPAVVIPGAVGGEDLQLAVELGLPLWAALPETVALFGSKSGSKRIFAAAEVSVAPGAHDIYDEADLLAYFSKLIVEHLSVARWLLKIDNESGGRGIAVVDTASFAVIQSIRAEKVQHASRWHLPEVVANAQERVVVALKKHLGRKAVLATPALYDHSWPNYAAAFFRVGGVIEAAPPFLIGSPSVNMLLSPDGSVTLLSSHDQVFQSSFVFGGANFPSSAPADLIHPAALRIGKQALKEGVIGFVGVDFVAWNEGAGAAGPPRLWAVDLNLQMTATQASFALFQFLLKGRYVWNSGSGAGGGLTHVSDPARYLVKTAVETKSASSAAGSRNSTRPPSGSSTPKLPELGRAPSHTSLRSSAAASALVAPVQTVTVLESERYYSSVPYLYHPHIATLQFGPFFQLCRLRGVAFDVRARVGTVFMLMDALASGSMGIMSVGMGQPPSASVASAAVAQQLQQQSASSLPSSPLHAMQQLVESLSFLSEQVSSVRFGAHLFDSESNLAPMLAAYRGLVKAQREANQMLLMERNSTLAEMH